ncbi:MAG: MATE family efflux transporter [Candidatus Eisenbacteria bacterium]|nr:MATE family efflux transporter [Candidatus Eisenbacteria bacterium]
MEQHRPGGAGGGHLPDPGRRFRPERLQRCGEEQVVPYRHHAGADPRLSLEAVHSRELVLESRDVHPGSNLMATDKALLKEDGILGPILRMGIPSMIGFLSLNIYDLTDMFWVSRLGADRIAAITLFQSFHWVINSANQVIGTGSVAVISRRYGAGDTARTEASIKETLLLKAVSGLLFGLLGFIFLPFIMELIGAEGNVLPMSVQYGRIMLAGLAVTFCTFSLYTALRSVGNPKLSMLLMLGGTALNMALDPFFIFGWGPFPELGLVGAAVASVTSHVLVVVAGIALLYGGAANVRLHLSGEEPLSWSSMRRILSISLPSAVNSVSWSMARLVIMPFIAAFGTGVVAAYGMANRVVALGILLVVGLGLGVASLIGQILGANLTERARRTAALALRTAAGINVVFALIVGALAAQIAGIFLHDPQVRAVGAEILRIQAFSFPFFAAFIMMEEIYSGAGDTVPPMIFGILLDWILMVPIIILGTRWWGFGPTAVWWTITLSVVAATIAFYIHYRRGTWLRRRV